MKIVVLDGYTLNPSDLSWEGFKALGDCTIYDRTSLTDEAEIISRIGDVLTTGYNVVDVATVHNSTLIVDRGAAALTALNEMNSFEETGVKKVTR